MIDIGLYAALGFLVASLLALMLAAPLWRRAVRLTKRRIEATMPMSVADIQADKDQLRAEYAIRLRRVEVALERAKERATRELVESNRRRVEITELTEEFSSVAAKLEEKENANRVLEQTIRRRLPDLESRLKAAKDVIVQLEAVNSELRHTVGSQSEALNSARATVVSQRADIDRLRHALQGDMVPFRGSSKSDATLVKENQRLSAELSQLSEAFDQVRAEAEENDLLRHQLNKLADQILTVARDQNLLVPMDHQPAEHFASEPAMQDAGEGEPLRQRGTNGANADDEDALDGRDASAKGDLVARVEVQPDEFGEEDSAEPKSPMAKRFAARRARRQALKIERGQSLSERLRSSSAEASET